MSQANSRNTLIPSRRAVLAGIATAPALAAPALALSGAAPPDPILAALAEHRRLDGMQYDIWERLQQIEVWGQAEIDLEAERCRICDAADQVGWTLTKIRPTTAAGAGALITYVRGDLETGEWQSPAMCNALEALAGMGDTALPAAAVAPLFAFSGPDPIFAAIERHRAADAYRDTLNEEDDETAFNAAGDVAHALAIVLGQTQPTTLAGVVTIIRYRREHDVAFPGHHLFIPEGCEGENTDPGLLMVNWLSTVERSITAIARGAVS
jgi:hypothetical protein